MDYISLFGIAVGLSMDAFAVSAANGATAKKVSFSFACKLAGAFGLFQALMPFLGWVIGKAGAALISKVDHWIALILLLYLGIKMIWESRKPDEESETPKDGKLSFKTLLVLAIATSIDALATGIILPGAVGASTLSLIALAVCLIGLTTFVLCLAGVYIGKKFGDLISSKAEIVGGIVLIAIGVKIFVEHMWLF